MMNEGKPYDEVAVINGEDGVAVRVTKRRSGYGVTQYSFSFFRTYPKGDEQKETHWFSFRHLKQIELLLPAVEQVVAANEAGHE